MGEEAYQLTKRQKAYLPFKRLLDIILSLIAILLLSPLLIVLFVIVAIDTKSFPIFRQRRYGKNNKFFLILKYRTMDMSAPKNVPTHELVDPEKYITRFGGWMRKTSLDELPQLFNIFVGHMSFIGPRPALYNQRDLMEGRTKQNVHLIRPGLSGWAQCNGRDEVDIPTKVALDVYYLRHFIFWLDVKVFFLSIRKAIKGENVLDGALPKDK